MTTFAFSQEALEGLARGNGSLALREAQAAPEDGIFDALLQLAGHGALDEAQALLPRLVGRAEEAHARELLASGNDGPLGSPATDDDEDLELVREESGADLIPGFLRFFQGRRDLYAQQWYDEKRKRSGYRPVEQPLTESVARAHLEGTRTLGQYLLFPDGTVSFAVIDLDLDANARAEGEAKMGQSYRAAQAPEIRAFALRLLAVAERLQFPLFPEDSGGKGLHFWCFFEPRVPARAARMVLHAILRGAGPTPAQVGVEVFPKQEQAGPRGLSSLVKLPLGVHQVTLHRCPLLGPQLDVLEPAEALARLKTVPEEIVRAMTGGRIVAMPSPEVTEVEPLPPLTKPKVPTRLPELLRAMESGRPEREAAERMMQGCSALSTLVKRAFAQGRLSADEARAVAYTFGLLGKEPSTAHDIFRAAQAPFKELDRLQRGLPSPMGCSKVRAIAGCASCNGCFQDAVPYSTPALHAVGATKRSVDKNPRRYAEHLEGEIAEDPLVTLASILKRMDGRLSRLEEERHPPDPSSSASGSVLPPNSTPHRRP